MRILFCKALCLLFVSVLQFLPAAQAAGTSYYVEPNGSGASCTRQSPCPLNTSLDKAQGGDQVVLLDGMYRQSLRTVRSGTAGAPIVIRAENAGKAVIQWPAPGGSYSSGSGSVSVLLSHSHITVRGLTIDGAKLSWSLFRMVGGSAPLQNLLVEHNTLRHSAGTALAVAHVNNLVIRHNRVEDLGNRDNGEGIYFGSNAKTKPVTNVEVYGNTFRGLKHSNFFDFKGDAGRGNVHHNIFENFAYTPSIDSTVDGAFRFGVTGGPGGNRFENNIVRNVNGHPYTIREEANPVVVNRNVLYNITATVFIDRRTSAPTTVTNNVICNGPTVIEGTPIASGNKFNQPQSACDAEVTRIMNAMKTLPGVSYDNTKSPQQLEPPRLYPIGYSPAGR